MPIVETKEQYISNILEETQGVEYSSIFLLALLDKINPDVFPLTLKGDKERAVTNKDRETSKRLYENTELTVDDICRLTGWSDGSVYQHLKAMDVEIDPGRRSKLTREFNRLKWDEKTFYFETNQLIIERKNNIIRLEFPAGGYASFYATEEHDLSAFVGEYIDSPIKFFYSPSRGHLGLKVDGFTAEYSKYVVPLFQKVMRSLGLSDVKLVSVDGDNRLVNVLVSASYDGKFALLVTDGPTLKDYEIDKVEESFPKGEPLTIVFGPYNLSGISKKPGIYMGKEAEEILKKLDIKWKLKPRGINI